ncbi:MAG: GNAT family N-acetyltransferase [Hyphomonadaceae bacterium]|nr:GNAT family N-acetyltransferase [Hyphomonadaceae bacterium]
MAQLAVKPLTRARWRDVEKLFGPQGAIMGCWCMYWRLRRADWDAARGAKAKALFKARVEKGPAPGLIAYAAGEPVGWMQIGPRADAPQWNTPRRVSAPAPDAPETDEKVWGVTCFFVKPSMRGQGVGQALVEAGIAYARGRGARLVEVCPIEGQASAGAAYVGRASVFARAGFKEIARRKQNRPLMRLKLTGARG